MPPSKLTSRLLLLVQTLVGLSLALPAQAGPSSGNGLTPPKSSRSVEMARNLYQWPVATEAGCGLTEPLFVQLTETGPRSTFVEAVGVEALGAALRSHREAATLARAKGCPGGDHLLVLADGGLPGSHLSAAMRAGGGAGISKIDLLIVPTREATPPAIPSSEGAPNSDNTPLILRADERGLHLGINSNGNNVPGLLPCTAPCTPETQQWTAAEAALLAVSGFSGTVVILSADRPISEFVQLVGILPPHLPLIGVATEGSPKGPADGSAPAAAASSYTMPKQVRVLPLSLPDTSRGPGAFGILEALPKEEISKTISRYLPAVRGCYNQALRTDPDLRLRLTTRFVIDGMGKVNDIQVRLSEEQSKGSPSDPAHGAGQDPSVVDALPAEFVHCLTEVIGAIIFPAPKGGGKVIVNYPFVFSPG
jgi:hypothetical protein